MGITKEEQSRIHFFVQNELNQKEKKKKGTRCSPNIVATSISESHSLKYLTSTLPQGPDLYLSFRPLSQVSDLLTCQRKCHITYGTSALGFFQMIRYCCVLGFVFVWFCFSFKKISFVFIFISWLNLCLLCLSPVGSKDSTLMWSTCSLILRDPRDSQRAPVSCMTLLPALKAGPGPE